MVVFFFETRLSNYTVFVVYIDDSNDNSARRLLHDEQNEKKKQNRKEYLLKILLPRLYMLYVFHHLYTYAVSR